MPEPTQTATTRVVGPRIDGLIDALDRIIDGGAAVCGDLVIALDGIDLIRVDLRLLLAGVQGAEPRDGRW